MPIPPHIFDEIVHKAFSSEIRRKILQTIAKKDKYLSEIAKEVNKKPQTIDFHLNILNEIGMVDSEWREGKKYYHLKDKKIAEFINERKPIPEKYRHKPPHEIVIDSMEAFNKRLDIIEKKIDLILKKK